MKEPNFFIIGAPKCGTTSLSAWLSEHPQIFLSTIKEPHYFNQDMSYRNIDKKVKYDKLFADADQVSHVAVGEASTWYLYSKQAIKNIEREYVKPKYIVMTRNPVEMAVSLHHHNLRTLNEDETDFEAAWMLQSKRKEGLCIPKTCMDASFLQYKEVCSLGTLLNNLYNEVDEQRILHISLDSLKDNPQKEYLKILKFLEVDNDDRQNFDVANEARGYKYKSIQKLLKIGKNIKLSLGINKTFGLAKYNDKALKKRKLEPSFESYLSNVFLEEIKILKKLSERR